MRPTPIILGLQLVVVLVIALGLLPWLSGDWRWLEGWIFGVWWVSLFAAVFSWLYYRTLRCTLSACASSAVVNRTPIWLSSLG